MTIQEAIDRLEEAKDAIADVRACGPETGIPDLLDPHDLERALEGVGMALSGLEEAVS